MSGIDQREVPGAGRNVDQADLHAAHTAGRNVHQPNLASFHAVGRIGEERELCAPQTFDGIGKEQGRLAAVDDIGFGEKHAVVPSVHLLGIREEATPSPSVERIDEECQSAHGESLKASAAIGDSADRESLERFASNYREPPDGNAVEAFGALIEPANPQPRKPFIGSAEEIDGEPRDILLVHIRPKEEALVVLLRRVRATHACGQHDQRKRERSPDAESSYVHSCLPISQQIHRHDSLPHASLPRIIAHAAFLVRQNEAVGNAMCGGMWYNPPHQRERG